MKKILFLLLFSTLVFANFWSGQVVDNQTSLPVAGANVSMSSGSYGNATLVNYTSTDASGWYNLTFANMSSSCELAVSSTGFNIKILDYPAGFCASDFSNFSVLDLIPSGPANLTITLSNTSGGLVNGTIYLNGQTESTNQTCNGTCTFTNLTNPVYNYTATASGYYNNTGNTSVVFNSTSNLSIILSTVSTTSNLTGAVFYGSTPIGSASMNVYAYPSNTLVTATTTNSTGLFSIQNIDSGAYILTVTAQGYNSWISQIPFIIPPSSSIFQQVSLTQQQSNLGPTPPPSGGGGNSYVYYGCNYNNPPCGTGLICVKNACVQPVIVNNTNTVSSNQTQNSSVQQPVENAYIITQNYTVNLTSGNSSYFIPISRTINVYAFNNSFITKISLSVFNNYSSILPDFYLRELIPNGLSNFTFYSTPSLMVSSNEPEWLALSLGSKSFFTVGYTFNYYTPSSNASLFTAPQVVAVQEATQSNFSNATANVTNSTVNSTSVGGLTGFATAFKSPLILGAVAVLAVLIAVLAYFTLKPDDESNEEENKGLKNIVEEVGKTDSKPKTRKSKK